MGLLSALGRRGPLATDRPWRVTAIGLVNKCAAMSRGNAVLWRSELRSGCVLKSCGVDRMWARGHNGWVERVRAYGLSLVLLGAVGWPAFRAPAEDGFPLSTYPMFAQRRGRVHEVVSARAVAADGSRLLVPPALIANAETMQAIRTVSRAIRAGEQEAVELCERIAARLRAADDPALRRAAHVELVTERVDAIDYLAGRAHAELVRVHARCPVSEGG